MKELVKPIKKENQFKNVELYNECTTNYCGVTNLKTDCTYNVCGGYNAGSEEDDIIF